MTKNPPKNKMRCISGGSGKALKIKTENLYLLYTLFIIMSTPLKSTSLWPKGMARGMTIEGMCLYYPKMPIPIEPKSMSMP